VTSKTVLEKLKRAFRAMLAATASEPHSTATPRAAHRDDDHGLKLVQ
jgi:galactose-1-phosphate uridylyltransferase